jgi:hypothetical protein
MIDQTASRIPITPEQCRQKRGAHLWRSGWWFAPTSSGLAFKRCPLLPEHRTSIEPFDVSFVPKTDSYTAAIVTTAIAGNWKFSPTVGVAIAHAVSTCRSNDARKRKSQMWRPGQAATRTKRKDLRWARDCRDP